MTTEDVKTSLNGAINLLSRAELDDHTLQAAATQAQQAATWLAGMAAVSRYRRRQLSERNPG